MPIFNKSGFNRLRRQNAVGRVPQGFEFPRERTPPWQGCRVCDDILGLAEKYYEDDEWEEERSLGMLADLVGAPCQHASLFQSLWESTGPKNKPTDALSLAYWAVSVRIFDQALFFQVRDSRTEQKHSKAFGLVERPGNAGMSRVLDPE